MGQYKKTTHRLDYMDRLRPALGGNPHLDLSEAPEIVRIDNPIETPDGNPFMDFDPLDATRGWSPGTSVKVWRGRFCREKVFSYKDRFGDWDGYVESVKGIRDYTTVDAYVQGPIAVHRKVDVDYDPDSDETVTRTAGKKNPKIYENIWETTWLPAGLRLGTSSTLKDAKQFGAGIAHHMTADGLAFQSSLYGGSQTIRLLAFCPELKGIESEEERETFREGRPNG